MLSAYEAVATDATDKRARVWSMTAMFEVDGSGSSELPYENP
jgi:hypothetical protein